MSTNPQLPIIVSHALVVYHLLPTHSRREHHLQAQPVVVLDRIYQSQVRLTQAHLFTQPTLADFVFPPRKKKVGTTGREPMENMGLPNVT
jgi:hypothetical protein